MVTRSPKVFVVVPNYRPVGGTAKMLDYAVHSANAGFDVIFTTIDDAFRGSSLLEKPYYKRCSRKIGFATIDTAEFSDGDKVLFSLPTNFNRIVGRAAALGYPSLQLIHVVQNVRHNNPFFESGFARQLLMKSMLRICITEQVVEAVEDLAPQSSQTILNMHGFDHAFFKLDKPKNNKKVRIGYNLFKSHFGKQIEAACMENELDVEFVRVASGTSWEDLRDFYHGCDIFLGTPLKEEGYYLPGIEALSGGCLLICPDAVGNRSYLASDACFQVEHENLLAYTACIEYLLSKRKSDFSKLQDSAINFASKFSLETEAAGIKKIFEKASSNNDL